MKIENCNGFSSLAILISAVILLVILFSIGKLSQNLNEADEEYLRSKLLSPSPSAGQAGTNDREDCFFTDDNGKCID